MGMIDSGYTSNAPLAYIGQTIWHDHRSYIPAGFVASDGQLLSRDNPLYKLVAAGRVPVCTEVEWWADPKKRGCYTTGTDNTNFRIPDRNGVQTGSYAAPVLRGDAAITAPGTTQANAAPDIIGNVAAGSAGTYAQFFLNNSNGAFVTSNDFFPAASGEAIGAGTKPADGGTSRRNTLTFKASYSNSTYGRDSTTEVRMNAVAGCYIICFAGKVDNENLLDALTLATRVEQVNSTFTANLNAVDTKQTSYDTWLPFNDPAVLEYFDWGIGTQASSELMVKIGPNSLEIRGIIRMAITSNSTVIYTLKKPLKGFTANSRTYQPAIYSITGTSAIVPCYTNAVNVNSYPQAFTIQAGSGTFQAGNWVMVNDVLRFA